MELGCVSDVQAYYSLYVQKRADTYLAVLTVVGLISLFTGALVTVIGAVLTGEKHTQWAGVFMTWCAATDTGQGQLTVIQENTHRYTNVQPT